MIPLDSSEASREAVRRSLTNHYKLVRFCLRGCNGGSRGSPRVSAPLADPFAQPNLDFVDSVDSALRLVLYAMVSW